MSLCNVSVQNIQKTRNLHTFTSQTNWKVDQALSYRSFVTLDCLSQQLYSPHSCTTIWNFSIWQPMMSQRITCIVTLVMAKQTMQTYKQQCKQHHRRQMRNIATHLCSLALYAAWQANKLNETAGPVYVHNCIQNISLTGMLFEVQI